MDHACDTQSMRLKTSWKPAKYLDVTWKKQDYNVATGLLQSMERQNPS